MCLYLPSYSKRSFIPNHLYMLEIKILLHLSNSLLLLVVWGLHWDSKKLCSKFCPSLLLGQITLPFYCTCCSLFPSWLPALVCLQGLVFVQPLEPAEVRCLSAGGQSCPTPAYSLSVELLWTRQKLSGQLYCKSQIRVQTMGQ